MKQPAGKHVQARRPIGRTTGLVIAISAGVAGTLAILVLADLRRDPAAAHEQGGPLVTVRHRGDAPELTGNLPLPPPSGGDEPVVPAIPPWEATPENTPRESIPPGHIPAWEVNPPPPDPNVPPPPPPVPPPDPASYRPPMDNPGGVDGDRPPRPLPE